MTTPESTAFSPAAALTEFMATTQANGIAFYEKIQLFTPWYGTAWAGQQAQYLKAEATRNGMLVAETANWLASQDILPCVEVNGVMGKLEGIGTDNTNIYQLDTLIGGRRHMLRLGSVALVDTTPTSAYTVNMLTRRGQPRATMRLGSILFQQAPLPYGSAI